MATPPGRTSEHRENLVTESPEECLKQCVLVYVVLSSYRDESQTSSDSLACSKNFSQGLFTKHYASTQGFKLRMEAAKAKVYNEGARESSSSCCHFLHLIVGVIMEKQS